MNILDWYFSPYWNRGLALLGALLLILPLKINLSLGLILTIIILLIIFKYEIIYLIYCQHFVSLTIISILPYFLLIIWGGIDIDSTLCCGDHSTRPSPQDILAQNLGNPFNQESQGMGLMPKKGAIIGFKQNLKDGMDSAALHIGELDDIRVDDPEAKKQFKDYTKAIGNIISLVEDSYKEAIIKLERSTDPLDVLQPWKSLEQKLSPIEKLPSEQLNPKPDINDGINCIERVIYNLLGDPTSETVQTKCSSHLSRILNEEVDLLGNGASFKAPAFDIANSYDPKSIDYYIGEPQVWSQWIEALDLDDYMSEDELASAENTDRALGF